MQYHTEGGATELLLSTKEYARLRGMDERQVRRMCETGKVPAVRMGGGCWLIQHDDEEEEGKAEREADGRARRGD